MRFSAVLSQVLCARPGLFLNLNLKTRVRSNSSAKQERQLYSSSSLSISSMSLATGLYSSSTITDFGYNLDTLLASLSLGRAAEAAQELLERKKTQDTGSGSPPPWLLLFASIATAFAWLLFLDSGCFSMSVTLAYGKRRSVRHRRCSSSNIRDRNLGPGD